MQHNQTRSLYNGARPNVNSMVTPEALEANSSTSLSLAEALKMQSSQEYLNHDSVIEHLTATENAPEESSDKPNNQVDESKKISSFDNQVRKDAADLLAVRQGLEERYRAGQIQANQRIAHAPAAQARTIDLEVNKNVPDVGIYHISYIERILTQDISSAKPWALELTSKNAKKRAKSAGRNTNPATTRMVHDKFERNESSIHSGGGQ